jgi:hypothetical protein
MLFRYWHTKCFEDCADIQDFILKEGDALAFDTDLPAPRLRLPHYIDEGRYHDGEDGVQNFYAVSSTPTLL